jgi:hypothetical protein
LGGDVVKLWGGGGLVVMCVDEVNFMMFNVYLFISFFFCVQVYEDDRPFCGLLITVNSTFFLHYGVGVYRGIWLEQRQGI